MVFLNIFRTKMNQTTEQICETLNSNLGVCEECGEPIRMTGTQLDCVNGCFEDDVRNTMSGDSWEQLHY